MLTNFMGASYVFITFSEVAFSASIEETVSGETVLNDGEIIIFNYVLLNIGQHYNNTSGIFTVPWKGNNIRAVSPKITFATV